MIKEQFYTEAELVKLFTNLKEGGITDSMAGALIRHTYNRGVNMRTSGFYYSGGTDSVIGWNNASRTFSLSPFVPDPLPLDGNGSVYVPHIRFYTWYKEAILRRLREQEEIQIPDEEGLYLISLKADQETLSYKLSYVKNPTYLDIAGTYLFGVIVSWVYWNATDQEAIYVGDSRHGSEWNAQMHLWAHDVFNSMRKEGIVIDGAIYDGDGSIDGHYQFGITAGVVWHEDIRKITDSVATGASLPVWYLDGSGLPRYTTPSGKKIVNLGRVAYNSGTGISEATNEWFVVYHYFATNCINQQHIAVMGKQYETVTEAVVKIEADVDQIRQDIPHSNLMHIGSLVFQTSDEYGNSAKARIITAVTGVKTTMSVVGDGSNTNPVKLKNDEDEPGDSKYYGTGDEFEPKKGFHHLHAKLVNQTAHGFAVNTAIRDTAAGWVKAQADSAENATTGGIVVEVIDADNFRFQSSGFHKNVAFTRGKEYALSPTVAGEIIEMPDDSYEWQIGWVRQSLGWGTDRGLKIEIDPGDEIISLDQPGLSAYEVAVQNGFEGTEQEWLDSLKASEGEDYLFLRGTFIPTATTHYINILTGTANTIAARVEVALDHGLPSLKHIAGYFSATTTSGTIASENWSQLYNHTNVYVSFIGNISPELVDNGADVTFRIKFEGLRASPPTQYHYNISIMYLHKGA